MELVVTLPAPNQQYVKTALHMEENYPGIHHEAIWRKVPQPSWVYEPIATGLAILFLPYTVSRIAYDIITSRRIIHKHERLIESFTQKVKNPSQRQYIDKVAEQVGITVPTEIKPLNPEKHLFEGDSSYGEIAQQGIEFDIASETQK